MVLVNTCLCTVRLLSLTVVGVGLSPALRAQPAPGTHYTISIPDSPTRRASLPRGAFLKAPVTDVTRLVQQVRTDPTVAMRYARLFHLPVKMVPLAFEQLHVKKLSREHVMQVHYVQAGEKQDGSKQVGSKQGKEQLVFKSRRVAAGTPVFCLPDGTPLLARICGNPLRATLGNPNIPGTNKPPAPVVTARGLVPGNTNEQLTVPSRDADALVLSSTAVPDADLPLQPAEDVLLPSALPKAPVLAAPALRAASLPPVYAWTRHTVRGLGGLGLLAPLLGFLNTQSGGSANLINPTTPTDDVPQPPITPISPGNPTLPASPPGDFDTPPNIQNTPEPGVALMGGAMLLSILGIAMRQSLRKK